MVHIYLHAEAAAQLRCDGVFIKDQTGKLRSICIQEVVAAAAFFRVSHVLLYLFSIAAGLLI